MIRQLQPRGNRAAVCRATVLFVALALAAPATVWADDGADDEPGSTAAGDLDDEERNYSRFFTGAFTEYSLRLGLSRPTDADYDGWHLDAGFRHSFPFLVGDTRLAYRFDRLTPKDGADDLDGQLDQHGLGAYLALHPGFLFLLGNDWLAYTLASIYGEVGAGGQMGVLEVGDDYETGFAPFVSVGAGVDIPLWNADAGDVPWLNLTYRWHKADFGDSSESLEVDMHLWQIGVGWRINGLLY